jgi:type I restriction enzyme M protein
MERTALPATLIAEWQSIEGNAGKPFPSYARTLKLRGKPGGESRYSWSIDFAARRAEAREQMQPLLDSAAEMKGQVVDLKEELSLLKRRKADRSTLDALAVKIKEKEKEARDLESKAAAIDAVVFDLKAVNPNSVSKVDARTPAEIIKNIEAQGKIVTEALGRLNALLLTSPVNS